MNQFNFNNNNNEKTEKKKLREGLNSWGIFIPFTKWLKKELYFMCCSSFC